MSKVEERKVPFLFKLIGYPLMVSPFILVDLAAVAWRALVIQYYWSWFVTPTWGYPVPSIHVAVGLLLMFYLIRYEYKPDNTKPEDRTFNNFMLKMYLRMQAAVLVPLVALVIGWLWKITI